MQNLRWAILVRFGIQAAFFRPGIAGEFFSIERELAHLMQRGVGDEEHFASVFFDQGHAMRSRHPRSPVLDESAGFGIKDDDIVARVIGEEEQPTH